MTYKIWMFRQVDTEGEELASYHPDNLKTCITGVTLKEANNNIGIAKDLLIGYTLDVLSNEDYKLYLEKYHDSKFVYKGWIDTYLTGTQRSHRVKGEAIKSVTNLSSGLSQ